MKIPYCVPDCDWHLNSIMFMNIILDLYYCKVLRFKLNGRTLAVASIFRDIESLEAEVAMEHQRAV